MFDIFFKILSKLVFDLLDVYDAVMKKSHR